jgi:hypothetical protein
MAMTTTVRRTVSYDLFHPDRPGWIPETVGDDWDRNPYAYQSPEELMPAGHLHGLYLNILVSMLAPVLNRLGLRLFIDVFIFYRDWEGRKQRIAPDAVIAPGLDRPDQSLHTYDLDNQPLPLCAIEVILPSSCAADEHGKRLFYAHLGIVEYLLLDVENDDEQPLDQIRISLWRIQNDIQLPVAPDSEGFVTLESLGVRLRADGRTLIAQDLATGEWLLDTQRLHTALAAAEQRANDEAQACAQAEAELARLRAEIAALQQSGASSKPTPTES